MANVLYRKLTGSENNGDYLRQDGNGPAYFQVAKHTDGQWWPQFTYNGADWFVFAPFATQALAQTALDNYITQLNAGTA